MAMRAKELGALGMQVNEKGQVIAKSSLMPEMESLVEETGLKCCICLEGYKNQPKKVCSSLSCVFYHMYSLHYAVVIVNVHEYNYILEDNTGVFIINNHYELVHR